MRIPAGENYIVEIEPVSPSQSSWKVIVYKKRFLFKKVVSSDWFLDEQQATTFARQLAEELRNGFSLTSFRERKPGWTLHRPPR